MSLSRLINKYLIIIINSHYQFSKLTLKSLTEWSYDEAANIPFFHLNLVIAIVGLYLSSIFPIYFNFPSSNATKRIVPSIHPIEIVFQSQKHTASTYFLTSNYPTWFFYNILWILIVLSLLPVTISLLSGLKDTQVIALAWAYILNKTSKFES